MVWVRDFAAVDIGQACQPGYEAARAGGCCWRRRLMSRSLPWIWRTSS